jgi:3'-phosphoadenosine 5'-phosphosulfate sulfotransferase (PAPS reductase)/FAD synthetase
MADQIALFNIEDAPDPRDIYGEVDLLSYNTYAVAFSGGKDSVAAVLSLLEAGVPRDRIELMHHRVDGGFSEGRVFDWPVTDAYVRAFAEAFDLKLFFSWKQAGIKGEMYRENEMTKPTFFETPEGLVKSGGDRGKATTRRMFPAVSASLSSRFCSSYVKIDVGSKAITGQTRFCNSPTLFISGERAEESKNRATYLSFEPHRTDRRDGKLARHVDHYRPVLKWSESEVWAIMERWGVRAHPCYEIGFGRCSCSFCIFGSADQFATLRKIDAEGFARIVGMEVELKHTMKNGRSLTQVADAGTPYEAATPERAALAMSTEYNESILVDHWTLPAGAYGDSSGPI